MNENTDQQDEQRTTLENMAIAEKLPLPFQCPQCEKIFKNPQALRMHKLRAHSKGWDTSSNFGRRGRQSKTEEERLEHRRKYQKNLRERYYREGKNSRGEQMPPGWKPRANIPGVRWSPERRRKFQRTMRLLKSKRIQIVYPDPRETQQQPEPTKNVRKMNFCPYCGEDIMRHLAL